MEKINLTEILKDCPRGMELYSPLCGDCKLYDITDYTIRIETPNKDTLISLYHDGRYCSGGEIMIFPKGKTTWEGFVPVKFKDGDVIYVKDKYNQEWCSIFNKCEDGKLYTYIDIYITNNNIYCNRPNILTMYKDMIEYRLATEEEKQKLFDTIKANGYKWNAETKTLDKLPKSYKEETMNKEAFYNNTQCCDIMNSLIKEEASSKFDITTLVPFESRVLVRDRNSYKWCGQFFSHYYDGSDKPYICIGVEGLCEYKQCIPYNDDTKYLLGTNNDCPEYYKTWK